MQYMPGKYYLISIDEDQDFCCITPFNVETVEQRYADVVMFNPEYLPKTETHVSGQLYGTMHIIKKEIDVSKLTYEDVLNLIEGS